MLARFDSLTSRLSIRQRLRLLTILFLGGFSSVTFLAYDTLTPEEHICKNKNLLDRHHFYLCIHESPWHHHFENDNYIATEQLAQKEMEVIIRQKHFIKLAVKIPFDK